MEQTPKDKDMFRSIGELADGEEMDGLSVRKMDLTFPFIYFIFHLSSKKKKKYIVSSLNIINISMSK